MGINWIGLYTIVRREVQRMLRVPIQVFVAPWISALLFIFIFGFVRGRHASRTIGGHRYIEFVLPGVLMMNIINAAFLQSSSAIYFSRFMRFVEEMLVAPLSYVEMIVGSSDRRGGARHRHRHRHSADGHWLRRHHDRVLAAVPVLDRGGLHHFRPARHHDRAVVQELRAAQHAGGVLPHAAFHGGRRCSTP